VEWQSHLFKIRRSLQAAKVVACLVLLEQTYEVAVLGVSLAQNPLVVIAALGALGFPLPSPSPGSEK
jgi:hypothetical protein